MPSPSTRTSTPGTKTATSSLQFKSKEGWKREKDKVQIMGRMGGQVGLIKPDNHVLNYYIRYERWEYILHTFVINHHYYIEGMVWDLYGCAHEPPCTFVEETLTSFERKAVHIKLVNFKDKGMCYEIHAHELEKLRIAVAAFVAILIKEEWKGLSEGNDYTPAGLLNNLKSRIFENKGFTYEEVQELIEADSPYVRIIRAGGPPHRPQGFQAEEGQARPRPGKAQERFDKEVSNKLWVSRVRRVGGSDPLTRRTLPSP